jgi:hypothetical protein
MIRTSGLISDAIWTVLVPPIMTAMWYLLSRMWIGVLGTSRSRRVQGWMRLGLWVVMGGGYAIGIFILIYAHFIKH